MAILDISKTLMYEFHYSYIKKNYGTKSSLLFTDTDSLCYEIEAEDFYKDISDDAREKFDTSNFPKNHPSGIPAGINKKVPRMMKDECGGKVISEFVGLRAKLYAYKMDRDSEEAKRCKGIKKAVIKNEISFEDYKHCLFPREPQMRKQNLIRSRHHELFTDSVNKIALSADDGKRTILPDRINTLAHGHWWVSTFGQNLDTD